jgi:hypothetical protein
MNLVFKNVSMDIAYEKLVTKIMTPFYAGDLPLFG